MIECTIPKGESERCDSTFDDLESQWVMYVDGALNANGLGARLILINPEGEDIQYSIHFSFSSINNETEYEALIIKLMMPKELGVQHLKAYNNSQLIVNMC